MKKIRCILHPLTLSLALIYFQTNFFFPSFLAQSYSVVSYFMVNAVLLGVIFGLMGCPACFLPLSMSLTFYHNQPKKTLLPAFVFNLARLVSIFLYSSGLSLGFAFISKVVNPGYILILNGAIMVVFSFIVARRIYFTAQLSFLERLKVKNVLWLYALWGFVLGFPCGIEATGFIVYLNSYPAATLSRILGLFFFSLFSILPVILLIFVLYLGFRKVNSLWSNFSVYLRNLAFFYLFFMGMIFIFMPFTVN